jgi:flavin-binding protein dodecin
MECEMSSAQENSVYKVIEIVGVSSESWEAATKAAVERASKTLRDLRVAEVVKLDVATKCPQTNEICFASSSPTQRCAP